MSIAIAAPHGDAVAAAEAAVQRGGNAIDAALAAAAALTVVYPHQCSLGGDLIALVRRPGEPVVAVISAGAAPAGIDVARLVAAGRMPGRGADTVTVPGVVAGWRALAALGGTQPLTDHFRAAAVLAGEATVSEGLARAIAESLEVVLADEGLAAVLTPGGTPLVEGDPLAQPALAATLGALAADPDSIYSGEIAGALVAALRSRGGAHSAEDFAAHRSETGPALSRTLDGTTWWVAPPPSQGAILLGLLPAALAAPIGGEEAAVSAALALAGIRDRLLGDPRTGPVDVASMVEGMPGATTPGPETRALGDTVAITVADSAGTVVTLIQSAFQTFGSGILDPATGIVLHNRGAAFTVDPESPGRLVPGSRPPHTLCPVIIEAPDAVIGIGCQGGRAQPWILGQVAPRLLDAADDPAAVLARPRWVIGARDIGRPETTVLCEAGAAVDAAAIDGVPVEHGSSLLDVAGHVQVVRLFGDATLDAATDPRADGSALVIDQTTTPENRTAR